MAMINCNWYAPGSRLYQQILDAYPEVRAAHEGESRGYLWPMGEEIQDALLAEYIEVSDVPLRYTQVRISSSRFKGAGWYLMDYNVHGNKTYKFLCKGDPPVKTRTLEDLEKEIEQRLV